MVPTIVTTKQHSSVYCNFLNNQDTREFYLIVINFATRQPGKRFWKGTINPNTRVSSKGVTSVTANHCLSNNLRFISTKNMREL